MSITALYCMRASIYRRFGVRCWTRFMDARKYPGPGPIIAHPPCGHWGRYKHTCKLPGKDCGPIAVEQVRRYGGVLEHPASSDLFQYCNCPDTPGQLDLYGGQIITINQSDYGHLAEKRTTLYIVGIDGPPKLLPPQPPGTTRLLESLTYGQRNRTPLRMALLMLTLISQVQTPHPPSPPTPSH